MSLIVGITLVQYNSLFRTNQNLFQSTNTRNLQGQYFIYDPPPLAAVRSVVMLKNTQPLNYYTGQEDIIRKSKKCFGGVGVRSHVESTFCPFLRNTTFVCDGDGNRGVYNYSCPSHALQPRCLASLAVNASGAYVHQSCDMVQFDANSTYCRCDHPINGASFGRSITVVEYASYVTDVDTPLELLFNPKPVYPLPYSGTVLISTTLLAVGVILIFAFAWRKESVYRTERAKSEFKMRNIRDEKMKILYKVICYRFNCFN